MDKVFLMHFVNYVRLHCTIPASYTKLNEDIDRAFRGLVNFDHKNQKCMSSTNFSLKQYVWRIDCFDCFN